MSKCKVCRGEFQRRSMTQKTCHSVECAMEWARRERIKAEKTAERGMRNQWRERREAPEYKP